MTSQPRDHMDLEANIQALVDGYKITIALFDIADSSSPANKKEIQL